VLSRRGFVNSCVALWALAGHGSAGAVTGCPEAGKPPAELDLALIDLKLDGDAGLAKRALVLVPAHGPPGRTYPGLVLLHGRGEVGDELGSIHAWRGRYGLAESYARLLRPPVRLAREQSGFMRGPQLDALNAGLLRTPFEGMVLICPVTPNPHAGGQPERVLDRYSEWIEGTLLPAVRARAPLGSAPRIGIDGCSMGGYVAAEVFVRKPQLFQTFGVVQPAIGEFRVARYARHLAAAGQAGLAGIHLQTSTGDPYRHATEAWGRQLERLGARHTLSLLPGPHDQRWLRATGTLAMLAWHHGALTRLALQ
jgi:hypothetical protein